jgi:hypothetical protein
MQDNEDNTPLHARQLNASCYGSKSDPDAPGDYIEYTGYSVPVTGPLPSREICDRFNAEKGEDNWKEHIYSWRDYVKYNLLQDGTVFLDSGRGSEEKDRVIEDPTTIALIHAMRDEDTEIARARICLADDVANARYNGDQNAFIALRAAISYCPGDPTSFSKDGIDFYSVGRNASHSFYMGLRKNDDGTISLFSGADAYDDPFSYREKETWAGGYYGHH